MSGWVVQCATTGSLVVFLCAANPIDAEASALEWARRHESQRGHQTRVSCMRVVTIDNPHDGRRAKLQRYAEALALARLEVDALRREMAMRRADDLRPTRSDPDLVLAAVGMED